MNRLSQRLVPNLGASQQGFLLDVREEVNHPTEPVGTVIVSEKVVVKRERLVRPVIVLECQTDLLEIVLTLKAARRTAGALHGGEEQSDQDTDETDDNESFHQRVAAVASCRSVAR
jgi:hypothetical protein